MAIASFKRFLKGIVLRPNASNPSEQVEGSLFHNSTNKELGTHLDGVDRIVITNDQVQTLENKTIDADSNTISNLADANIKDAAAINAEKIAAGSVDNTEFGYLDGVTSPIQTQINDVVNTANNAANKNLSNIENTSISDDLVPADATKNLGGVASIQQWAKLYARQGLFYDPSSGTGAGIEINSTSTYPISNPTPLNIKFGQDGYIYTSNVTGGSNTSNSLSIGTGNAVDGDSGEINIQTGNTVNGDSGKILLSTGSSANGAKGVIDVDSSLVSNVAAPVADSDAANKKYVDDSIVAGGANKTLSNLDSPTAINQDLLVASDDTLSIGTDSAAWQRVYSRGFYLFNSDCLVYNNSGTPSGSTNAGIRLSSQHSEIFTYTFNKTASDNSNNISIETGNTEDGNSGSIVLRPGIPSGSGTKGHIDATSSLIKNVASPVDGTDAANKDYVDSLTSTLEIQEDGSTVVSAASVIDFDGSVVVSDEGGGVAKVTVTGGGSVSGTPDFIPKFNSTGDGVENSTLSEDDDVIYRTINSLTPAITKRFIHDSSYGVSTYDALNLFIGYDSGSLDFLSTTSMNNLGLGHGSLGSIYTYSANNIAIGNMALGSLTSASSNIAIGYNAGHDITTGSNNILIGANSGRVSSSSDQNVIIGNASGGTTSTKVGAGAVLIGHNAGSNFPEALVNVNGVVCIGSNAGPPGSTPVNDVGTLYINSGQQATNSPLIYGGSYFNGKFIRINDSLQLPEVTVIPPTPAANHSTIYVKTDSNLYYKNDAGTEFQITGGSPTPTSPYVIESESSNFNAASGNTYLIDSTSNTVTVTLPPSPTSGEFVILKDSAGTSDINNIIVTGGNIDSVSGLIIDSPFASVTLVSDGTNWFIIE